MNEHLPFDGASNVPWPTSERRERLPDTTAQPAVETAAPSAADLLGRVAQGAHHTIDRLAGSAQGAAQQLDAGVSAAGQALHARTDRLRETSDQWVEGARATVRSNPLLAIAAAAALGAVLIGLTRRPVRTRGAP